MAGWEREQARKRQAEAGKANLPGARQSASIGADSETGRVREVLASKAGVGVKTVERAIKVRERGRTAEIDENLCRAELTAAQRASAIKRRKEVWEAMHPELSDKLSDNSRGPGRPVEFASDTESKTGQNQRDIRRHVARAEALGDDLDHVVGTSLDKGVELDALKSLPAEDNGASCASIGPGRPAKLPAPPLSLRRPPCGRCWHGRMGRPVPSRLLRPPSLSCAHGRPRQEAEHASGIRPPGTPDVER